jgi:hypothetical protein
VKTPTTECTSIVCARWHELDEALKAAAATCTGIMCRHLKNPEENAMNQSQNLGGNAASPPARR